MLRNGLSGSLSSFSSSSRLSFLHPKQSERCKKKRRQIAERVWGVADEANLPLRPRLSRGEELASESGEIWLTEEVAIASFINSVPLATRRRVRIPQELTMALPFLGNFLLSEDRDCDLSVGLSLQAFVERDESVLQTLVARK